MTAKGMVQRVLALWTLSGAVAFWPALAHARTVESSGPSLAVSTDPKEITRIINTEMAKRHPSVTLSSVQCNREWVCRGQTVMDVDEAFDPVTHKLQATADEPGTGLLFTDEAHQLEVLARLARAIFRNKPVDQSIWVEQTISNLQKDALALALGMETGAPKDHPDVGAGGGIAISITKAPFAAEIRYRDSLVAARANFLTAEPQKYGARWQARHQCGGTLIDHDWVLTAAHCIKPDSVNGFLAVQLGVTDVSGKGGYQVDVDGAVVHSGYNRGGLLDNANGFDKNGDIYHDDIALLHLAPNPAPRDPASIAVAPLELGQVEPGTKVEAVGWGRSNKEGPDTINVTAILQHVDLTLLDNNACKKMPGYRNVRLNLPNGAGLIAERIHAGVLCVKGERQKTCDGDSGGPLFHMDSPSDTPRLIGIVSVNKSGCDIATDDRPGIYTRVSAYRDWITEAMKNPPKSGQTIFLPKVR